MASACWLPDGARKPHRMEDRVQNPEFRATSPEACPYSGYPVFEPIHFLYVKASLSWKPKHPNDSLNPHFIFSNPLVSPRERGSNCKARQSNTIKLNWCSVGVDWHPLCSQQELAIVSQHSKNVRIKTALPDSLSFSFSPRSFCILFSWHGCQKGSQATGMIRVLKNYSCRRHGPVPFSQKTVIVVVLGFFLRLFLFFKNAMNASGINGMWRRVTDIHPSRAHENFVYHIKQLKMCSLSLLLRKHYSAFILYYSHVFVLLPHVYHMILLSIEVGLVHVSLTLTLLCS